MDLVLHDTENNTSSNCINKIIDDAYNENLNFLLKNKSEGEETEDKEEKKDVDQLSFKMEALITSLEEETRLLNMEKNDMRKTFQDIALQLKNVKWSLKEADQCLQEFNKREKTDGISKFFQDMEKVIEKM